MNLTQTDKRLLEEIKQLRNKDHSAELSKFDNLSRKRFKPTSDPLQVEIEEIKGEAITNFTSTSLDPNSTKRVQLKEVPT